MDRTLSLRKSSLPKKSLNSGSLNSLARRSSSPFNSHSSFRITKSLFGSNLNLNQLNKMPVEEMKVEKRINRNDRKIKEYLQNAKMKSQVGEKETQRKFTVPVEIVETKTINENVLSFGKNESQVELNAEGDKRELKKSKRIYDSLEDTESRGNTNAILNCNEFLWQTYFAFHDVWLLISIIIVYYMCDPALKGNKFLLFMAVSVDFVNFSWFAVIPFKKGKKKVKDSILDLKHVKFAIYMLTWFPIDLVSSLPMTMAYFQLGRNFRVMSVISVGLKVLKLKKKSSFISRLVFVDNIQTNRLFKSLIVFLISVYYFSTCWVLVLDYEIGLVEAIYFTVTTSLTVGYGDITPKTTEERMLVMLVQVVGVLFYSLFISQMALFFDGSSPEQEKIERESAILLEMYAETEMDKELYEKLKEYIQNHENRIKRESLNFINSLPANLRKSVLNDTFGLITSRQAIFVGADDNFVSDSLSRLNYITLEKNDILIGIGEFFQEVNFVSKGKVSVRLPCKGGTVNLAYFYTNGMFGLGETFSGEQSCCDYLATSARYTGFMLRRTDLIELMEIHFKHLKKHIDRSFMLHQILLIKSKFAKNLIEGGNSAKFVENELDTVNSMINEKYYARTLNLRVVKNILKSRTKINTRRGTILKFERSPKKMLKSNVDSCLSKLKPLKRSLSLDKIQRLESSKKVKSIYSKLITNLGNSPIVSRNMMMESKLKVSEEQNKRRQSLSIQNSVRESLENAEAGKTKNSTKQLEVVDKLNRSFQRKEEDAQQKRGSCFLLPFKGKPSKFTLEKLDLDLNKQVNEVTVGDLTFEIRLKKTGEELTLERLEELDTVLKKLVD